jgi:hypothetical protein
MYKMRKIITDLQRYIDDAEITPDSVEVNSVIVSRTVNWFPQLMDINKARKEVDKGLMGKIYNDGAVAFSDGLLKVLMFSNVFHEILTAEGLIQRLVTKEFNPVNVEHDYFDNIKHNFIIEGTSVATLIKIRNFEDELRIPDEIYSTLNREAIPTYFALGDVTNGYRPLDEIQFEPLGLFYQAIRNRSELKSKKSAYKEMESILTGELVKKITRGNFKGVIGDVHFEYCFKGIVQNTKDYHIAHIPEEVKLSCYPQILEKARIGCTLVKYE